jgi:hypothetical protein
MLETQNTFFIPQTIGIGNVVGGIQIVAKPSMYCTNYHHTNHNIKTCRSKKEEPIITAIKVATQVGKPPRLLNYPCHICGIVGHKLTNCLIPLMKCKVSSRIKEANPHNLNQWLKLKWLLLQLTWWRSMLPFEVKQVKNKCLKIKGQGRTNLQ